MSHDRLVAIIPLVSALGATQALACSTASLDRLLAAPVPAKADREIDVEGASSEGGQWRVFGGGRPFRARQIVRTDYGEMGRSSLRLVMAEPATYALTRVVTTYDRPFTQPGFRARTASTKTYRFCAGELVRPKGQDDAAFAAHRAEADTERAAFGAAEIGEYVKGAGL